MNAEGRFSPRAIGAFGVTVVLAYLHDHPEVAALSDGEVIAAVAAALSDQERGNRCALCISRRHDDAHPRTFQCYLSGEQAERNRLANQIMHALTFDTNEPSEHDLIASDIYHFYCRGLKCSCRQ